MRRFFWIVFVAIIFAPSFLAAQTAEIQAKGQVSIPLMVDGRLTEEIWLVSKQGRFRFTAEIADTQDERSQGLMHRRSMPQNHGMLFDFQKTDQVLMWMKNTPLSLDMIFVGENGVIVNIAERTKPFSEEIIASAGPVSHVLEINGGVSKLLGLKAGDRLEHALFGNVEVVEPNKVEPVNSAAKNLK